jgi:hypothetical protein
MKNKLIKRCQQGGTTIRNYDKYTKEQQALIDSFLARQPEYT